MPSSTSRISFLERHHGVQRERAAQHHLIEPALAGAEQEIAHGDEAEKMLVAVHDVDVRDERVTSSRSLSTTSPTLASGGNELTTGSISRPMVPGSYSPLRCHWRATSAGAAAMARSRASLGSSASTSCARPG